MEHRPIIGITTEPNPSVDRVSVGRTYQDCVLEAGGLPLLLPYGDDVPPLAEDIIASIDGLLLTGGGDLCPEAFDEHPYREGSDSPISWMMPLRDLTEIKLARLAWERGLPVFGVCRGMQLMNVVHGGTMVRDADEIEREDAIVHNQREDVCGPAHEVILEPDSIIAGILGTDRLSVNTLHHQALADIAPAARVAGRATDGIVEALEFPEHPFYLGVQWHPERMKTTPELFRAHVEAARAYRAS